MGLSQGLILSRASRTSEKAGSLRSGEFKVQLPAGAVSKKREGHHTLPAACGRLFLPCGTEGGAGNVRQCPLLAAGSEIMGWERRHMVTIELQGR